MREHNQHLKTDVFLNKFTLFQIKPNIYIWKTKFDFHKQYLFCLLTSRNAKKSPTDQSTFSYFVWKETIYKLLKVAAAKSLFSIVYVIGTTCFDECFWFYVIPGRHYFSWKFIVTLILLKRHVAAFFEASILKEVRILCVISAITIWC